LASSSPNRQIMCRFTNAAGEPEIYSGVITRLGLDLGVTAGGQLVWAVFAPSGPYARALSQAVTEEYQSRRRWVSEWEQMCGLAALSAHLLCSRCRCRAKLA
jgi:hypothetical protein